MYFSRGLTLLYWCIFNFNTELDLANNGTNFLLQWNCGPPNIIFHTSHTNDPPSLLSVPCRFLCSLSCYIYSNFPPSRTPVFLPFQFLSFPASLFDRSSFICNVPSCLPISPPLMCYTHSFPWWCQRAPNKCPLDHHSRSVTLPPTHSYNIAVGCPIILTFLYICPLNAVICFGE